MIKDFVQNETITEFLAVRKKEIREYNDRQYVTLEFGDRSGRIGGVWWEPDKSVLDEVHEGDIVKVKGVVGIFRERPQLRVAQIRLANEDEYSLDDILPRSIYAEKELSAKIGSLSERVENGFIKNLMQSFWTDEQFFREYLKAAAGKLWHHSYIGGLAEHSINVAEICLDMSRRYDFVDRDLLIFGGLFHDMGKMKQYQITSYIDFTDEGRLIGHITLADNLITERAGKIDSFPPKLLMKLRHLILSHHGQVEYASPVVPMIPEAFILYYADEIDSKMGAIARIREKSKGQGWSEYINLISRKIYFGEEQ